MEIKNEWKDIPGYEGRYRMNERGLVLAMARTTSSGNTIKERVLIPSTGMWNVLQVKLTDGLGNRKTYSLKKLKAMVFGESGN